MNKLEFLKGINLKEEYNLTFLKQAAKSLSDLNFDKADLKTMIDYILTESKDLNVFLNTVDELRNEASDESIEFSMKQLKHRFKA